MNTFIEQTKLVTMESLAILEN